MLAEDPINTFEWVERLGGWTVVALIVRWFMARIDTRDQHVERLIISFEAATEEFKRYNAEERIAHEIIMRKLGVIEEAVESDG